MALDNWPTESDFDIHALEGDSYAVDPQTIAAAIEQHQGARLVGTGHGARALSMFVLNGAAGDHSGWTTGDSETVLFVLNGHGTVAIGDRAFAAKPGCGIYVRAGECFGLRPLAGEDMRVLATVCPSRPDLESVEQLATYFDGSQPQRMVDAALCERHATGDRFYKLLVGPSIGCREVTQFVGVIPPSKAPEHYHEYEEAICVLSGEGRAWTGEVSAPISAGSVLFLPRGQRHCLEATSEDGMSLVGFFYPASSPAVRYDTA